MTNRVAPYEFDLFVDPKDRETVEKLAVNLGMKDSIVPVTASVQMSGRAEFKFHVKGPPDLNLFSMMLGALVASSITITAQLSGQLISIGNWADAAQLVCNLQLRHSDAPATTTKNKATGRSQTQRSRKR